MSIGNPHETILEFLNSGNPDLQIPALYQLSDNLSFANDETLGDFPVHQIAIALLNCLNLNTNTEYIQSLAAKCMASFLNSHTRSTRALIENGALDLILQSLNNSMNIETIEQLLRSTQVIAEYRPDDLGNVVGLAPFLRVFQFVEESHQANLFDSPNQRLIFTRLIFHTIYLLTSQTFYDNYFDSLDGLIAAMNIEDQKSLEDATNSVLSIFSKLSSSILKRKAKQIPRLIKSLCDILQNLRNEQQIDKAIQFLRKLSDDYQTANFLVDSGFDFNVLVGSSIVNENDEEEETIETATLEAQNSIPSQVSDLNVEAVPFLPINKNSQTTVFETILNLLPVTQFPICTINRNRDIKMIAHAKEFAERVQPVLLNYLLKASDPHPLSIISLAQTLSLTPNFKITKDLIHVLCGFAQQEHLRAQTLYFVQSNKNKDPYIKYGLVSALINKPLPNMNTFFKWYLLEIDKLTKECKVSAVQCDFKQFKDIWSLIKNLNQFAPYELLSEGCLEHAKHLCSDLIKKPSLLQNDPHTLDDFQPLVDALLKLLKFLQVYPPNDDFKSSLNELVQLSLPINIQIENPPIEKPQQKPPPTEKNDSVPQPNPVPLFKDPMLAKPTESSFANPPKPMNTFQSTFSVRNFTDIYTRLKNCAIFGENFYNFNIQNKSISSIGSKWRQKQTRLEQIMLQPPIFDDVQKTTLSAFYHAFEDPNYTHCTFMLNQKQKLYPYDPIFRFALSTPQDMKNKMSSPSNLGVLTVTPYEQNYDLKEIDLLTPFQVPTFNIDAQLLEVLNLLKFLKEDVFPHIKTPQPTKKSVMNLKSPKFETKLTSMITTPFPVVTCLHPSVQIIGNFPFLFSYETRFYIYKSITVSYYAAIKNAVQLKPLLQLSKTPKRKTLYSSMNSSSSNLSQPQRNVLTDHSTHLKVQIDRNRLFEDGCLLLEKFGHPFFFFDISYDDEAGVGIGPTREFFSSLGLEFCKTKRNMWRPHFLTKTEENDESLVENPQGLYPMINAPVHLFELLGKLCGKAVEMDYLISIPFSTAFFKAFKGLDVGLEEIDPQLAQSLQKATLESMTFLPFVYPGTEIELKEGGKDIEITEENFEEYKQLVKKFTLNLDAIEAFKRGFHSIISPGFDSFFSPTEFIHLICGNELGHSKLTITDFLENTMISHGYTSESPQIAQLFEVVESFSTEHQKLFVRFVTGSERLPVGGLKNLTPRFTIARKEPENQNQNPDHLLPSVMTCTNYFKLPPYSSKEIMREKLLIAICEGQGAFLLT